MASCRRPKLAAIAADRCMGDLSQGAQNEHGHQISFAQAGVARASNKRASFNRASFNRSKTAGIGAVDGRGPDCFPAELGEGAILGRVGRGRRSPLGRAAARPALPGRRSVEARRNRRCLAGSWLDDSLPTLDVRATLRGECAQWLWPAIVRGARRVRWPHPRRATDRRAAEHERARGDSGRLSAGEPPRRGDPPGRTAAGTADAGPKGPSFAIHPGEAFLAAEEHTARATEGEGGNDCCREADCNCACHQAGGATSNDFRTGDEQ